jgi:phosphoribosylformylglycinamidine cyclo-ligase
MKTYAEEVIKPGDAGSKIAKEETFKTHGYNPAVSIWPQNPGHFRSAVAHSWAPHILDMMRLNFDKLGRRKRVPVMSEVTQNDGTGGKPQFFSLINTPEVWRGHGRDLVAMAADDMRGCLPAWIDNEVCVQRMTDQNLPLFEALMQGYVEACEEAGLVNVTGELAIMKDQVTGWCDTQSDDQLLLTWTGSCTGLLYKDFNIFTRGIGCMMPIVGFLEDGYRCNGGGWFTKLLMAYYGSAQAVRESDEAMEFVRRLTTPSKIYCKALARVMGWTEDAKIGKPLADIRAIAHITGGGLGKLAEVLPERIGAHLDLMPIPPSVLLEAQEMSIHDSVPKKQMLTDEEGYTTLNGGIGMAVIVNCTTDAVRLINAVEPFGIKAQIIGETWVTDDPKNKLVVHSRFGLNPGKTIYPLEKTA